MKDHQYTPGERTPIYHGLKKPPPVDPESFRKNDTGKLRWSLLPFDALKSILLVFMFGAEKYTDRNWEKGTNYSRVYDALLRHLTDWWQGNDKGKGPGRDADTGYSDLWHAGANLLFLVAFEGRGIGKDDRPPRGNQPE